jgi:NADH:ubiquinone oxidoreductase subunit D
MIDPKLIPPGFTYMPGADETEEFFLNMGPQHPATHGVLRLVARLDGETVKEIVPHLGYIHRGIEKMGESQSYLQYIHLTDRMDYMCSHMNNLSVCLAIEKAMNIGVPERGEYIRVLVNELQRISSHLLFWACFGGDLGAVTAFLHGFKERELITDIFDEMCGARLTMNFFRPGGSFVDVPDTFIPRVKSFSERMKRILEEYDKLVTGNIIIKERTIGVGVLSAETAVANGVSGPTLRASGVPFDLRKDDPYSIYNQFEFDIPIAKNGDSYDRYNVRMQEIRESLRIIDQAVERFPQGQYRSKEKPSFRLPTGSYYAQVETAKGIFGTYIVAEKGDKPYRIKSRSPNFSNLTVLNEMCKGHKIADIITILTTLDVVIPDMDR